MQQMAQMQHCELHIAVSCGFDVSSQAGVTWYVHAGYSMRSAPESSCGTNAQIRMPA